MGFFDDLKKGFDVAIDVAGKVVKAAEETSDKLTPQIEEAFQKAGKKTKEATDFIHDKAYEISPETVDFLDSTAEKTKQFTENVATAVSDSAAKVFDAVVDVAKDISPEGVEFIKDTTDAVKEKTVEMNILNSTLKKEALDELYKVNKAYEEVYTEAVNKTVNFHNSKLVASELIKKVEKYINTIANSPKEIKSTVIEITLNRSGFEELIDDLEIENAKNVKISGSSAGAGVLAGAGIAAFGPTAAIAIATTFGTASTGVAISSLTGAAATKAALAWLGGGTIAAGGGGVAGGNALLAMAGPVGWTIGGIALAGSGLFLNSKNKKTAADAEEARKDIENETFKMKKIISEVTLAQEHIANLCDGVSTLLSKLILTEITDYIAFSVEDKHNLGILVNTTKALSEYINKGLIADE